MVKARCGYRRGSLWEAFTIDVPPDQNLAIDNIIVGGHLDNTENVHMELRSVQITRKVATTVSPALPNDLVHDAGLQNRWTQVHPTSLATDEDGNLRAYYSAGSSAVVMNTGFGELDLTQATELQIPTKVKEVGGSVSSR